MKYYYNNTLVRSSKNEYKYGLLMLGWASGKEKIDKCSIRKEILQAEIEKRKREAYGENSDLAYMIKKGYPQEEIEAHKARLQKHFDSMQVVELEAR